MKKVEKSVDKLETSVKKVKKLKVLDIGFMKNIKGGVAVLMLIECVRHGVLHIVVLTMDNADQAISISSKVKK